MPGISKWSGKTHLSIKTISSWPFDENSALFNNPFFLYLIAKIMLEVQSLCFSPFGDSKGKAISNIDNSYFFWKNYND